MTVAILGAGAIGGLLGAHLARSGEDVILIARGAHLEAMRDHGVTVRRGGQEFHVRARCTDDVAAIRGAGTVFVTLKAHSFPALAPAVGTALDRGTCVVGAMNGIPWWYFRDRRLESVDPGGVIARSIPYEQVVGCVVYPAATLVEPGVIEHEEGDRISLGEPDGTSSDRVKALSAMLTRAGFKAPVQTRLRNEIWLKLIGNATLNPASAVTRTNLGELLGGEDGRRLVRTLMAEVDAVARSLGVEIPVGIERRIDGAAAVGRHKTSMLQDLEARKPLELDALVGAVVELAGQERVSVPSLRLLHDLARVVERVAQARG